MPRRKRSVEIGPMSGNSGGIPHYIPPRIQLDTPTRVTNAGSKQPLVLASEWASAKRPGSEIAFSLPSRGVSC